MQQQNDSSSVQQPGHSGASVVPGELTKVFQAKDLPELLMREKVLVMFTSPRCAPCHLMYPILEEYSKLLSRWRLSFPILVIDVLQLPEIAARYRVRSLPTLMLFKDGNPAKTHFGTMNHHELRKFTGV